jgi:hypothetical protein
MRATAPILTTFAALCIVAAGCTGGGAPNLPYASAPSGSNAVSTTASAGDSFSSARANASKAQLVVPLRFDGKTFTVAHFGSCASVALGDAATYAAPKTGRFKLAGKVTIAPRCVGLAHPSSRLYLAAAEIGTNVSFQALGGPSDWKGSRWTFEPGGAGLVMTARAKYVFYIVALPATSTAYPSPTPYSSPTPYASPTPYTTPTPYSSPTPAPPQKFILLQALSFNGSSFSLVANACFRGNPNFAPPYVAPTSGPLTLSGNVTIAPTCVPSPLPSISPLPTLTIVAVALASVGSDKHAHVAHPPAAHGFHFPLPLSWGVPAVAVASGASISAASWVFTPDSPGLTVTGGASYAFFIAVALPTPPPQPKQYRAVVPLNFDGTNFTVPSITSCSNLPTPTPYTAPTSGPLTLAGTVSIAPTCPPSSSGYGSGGGGGGGGGWVAYTGGYASPSPGPLYIVASEVCSNGSGSGGGGSYAESNHRGGGNGCSWNGSDLSSDHGGGCGCGYHGGGGGGSSNARSHHWGGGHDHGCTIDGFAIAGPVNVTDDPWNFAPLSPPLTLTGGAQYVFYIGEAVGHQSGGGGGWGDSLRL